MTLELSQSRRIQKIEFLYWFFESLVLVYQFFWLFYDSPESTFLLGALRKIPDINYMYVQMTSSQQAMMSCTARQPPGTTPSVFDTEYGVIYDPTHRG